MYLKVILCLANFNMNLNQFSKDLELKSEDDFDRNAPDVLKTEEVMMGDEHEVICARLKWENQERIELQKTLDLGSEKKDTLEEEVDEEG